MQLFQPRPPADKVVEKSEQKPRENRKLIIGGLTAFSGACVVQLLGLSRLDHPLTLALYAFALSLPLLVRDVLDVQGEDRHGFSINLDARLIATTTGITSSIAGIAALFWHLSPLMSAVFLASSLWSMWTHTTYLDKLRAEAEADETKGNHEQ